MTAHIKKRHRLNAYAVYCKNIDVHQKVFSGNDLSYSFGELRKWGARPRRARLLSGLGMSSALVEVAMVFVVVSCEDNLLLFVGWGLMLGLLVALCRLC